MLDNQFINDIIGVKEAYQMPEKLMDILSDRGKREDMFDKFLERELDLSYDWFTQYYQEEHGDRDKLKQDFTPDSICQIVTGLNGHAENVADICSGTGGLTIKMWQQNPDAFFHCEEVAARAVPVLLFNLAIRGINGEVIHGNVLTGKRTAVYRLERNGKYRDIIPDTAITERQFDKVIMNPPYSLSWSGEEDGRFRKYGTPPKSKADYASEKT